MSDLKRDLIIEGAIKRFIHFGINKTTMNEIADDISLSKPSLYYYFPDKSSLIIGVIETIFAEYHEALQQAYKLENPIEKSLDIIIEIKNCFFEKYYMLHLSDGVPDLSINTSAIKQVLENIKKKELEFYSNIFVRAEVKGEIQPLDSKKTAELYIDSINGLTSLCTMHSNKEIFPGKIHLKNVLQKQKELSNIFVKGLKTQL